MTRFVLRQEPPVRVALDMLIPEQLAPLSLAEIERLPLLVGNRRERVGDWFRVEEGERGRVEIEGGGSRLDRIGAGMSTGEIILPGDAGAWLGLGMRGGRLAVGGSAGHGVATGLGGGLVRIAGDVGDGLGGNLPGAVHGMCGGTVIVGGHAAGRVGHRLRRGLILVGGDVRTGCGSDMAAGTIIVGGTLGAHAGVGMQRGSIIVLGGLPAVGPGFVDGGAQELLILRLLDRYLTGFGMNCLAGCLGPMQRFIGDKTGRGRGEIFVLL